MFSKVVNAFSIKAHKPSNSNNFKTANRICAKSSLPDLNQESVTLTDRCGYVPTVLVNAAKIIEENLDVNCLFQIQGAPERVEYLIQILSRDRMSTPRNVNVHDAVEVMKTFVGSLASPIIPDAIMKSLIQRHQDGTDNHTSILFQYRKALPHVVPSVHFLLLLMNKIANLSHVNGMDARKLATIFVLDILKPLSVPEIDEDCVEKRLQRVQILPYKIMVVEYLIQNVEIFELVPFLCHGARSMSNVERSDHSHFNFNGKSLRVGNTKRGDKLRRCQANRTGTTEMTKPESLSSNIIAKEKTPVTRTPETLQSQCKANVDGGQSSAIHGLNKPPKSPLKRAQSILKRKKRGASSSPGGDVKSLESNPVSLKELSGTKTPQNINKSKTRSEKGHWESRPLTPVSAKPPHSELKQNGKRKKRGASTSPCSGHRSSSNSRSLSRDVLEARSSHTAKSGKCKRWKSKENKGKMFKQDEELLPWDGSLVDNDDLSLIIRTTKNPKTFKCLEKHFLNLEPGKGNFEKELVDETAIPPQEALELESPVKRGRFRKRISTSPKQGKLNRTAALDSMSVSNSKKPPEKTTKRLFAPISSASVDVNSHKTDEKHKAASITSHENSRIAKGGSMGKKEDNLQIIQPKIHQPSQSQRSDSNAARPKAIESRGSIKTSPTSLFDIRHPKNLTGIKEYHDNNSNNMEKPRGRSLGYKLVDWAIDVSLVSVAFLCAYFIYNLI